MLEDYGEGKNDVLLKEKDYVSVDNSSSFDEEIQTEVCVRIV